MKETFQDALAVLGIIGEKATVVDGDGKTVTPVSELLKAGGMKNGVTLAAALLWSTQEAMSGEDRVISGFGTAGLLDEEPMSAERYNGKYYAAMVTRHNKGMEKPMLAECSALSIIMNASLPLDDGGSVLSVTRLFKADGVLYGPGHEFRHYALMLDAMEISQVRSADMVKRWLAAAADLARVYIDADESAVPAMELAA